MQEWWEASNDSQAKPGQSANWGDVDLREAQFDVPRLLAIPTFDRIAGLCNRRLNPNWGIWLR